MQLIPAPMENFYVPTILHCQHFTGPSATIEINEKLTD